MNFTCIFFNFCRGGGQRFFTMTLISEYKVSALMDETWVQRSADNKYVEGKT